MNGYTDISNHGQAANFTSVDLNDDDQNSREVREDNYGQRFTEMQANLNEG